MRTTKSKIIIISLIALLLTCSKKEKTTEPGPEGNYRELVVNFYVVNKNAQDVILAKEYFEYFILTDWLLWQDLISGNFGWVDFKYPLHSYYTFCENGEPQLKYLFTVRVPYGRQLENDTLWRWGWDMQQQGFSNTYESDGSGFVRKGDTVFPSGGGTADDTTGYIEYTNGLKGTAFYLPLRLFDPDFQPLPFPLDSLKDTFDLGLIINYADTFVYRDSLGQQLPGSSILVGWGFEYIDPDTFQSP